MGCFCSDSSSSFDDENKSRRCTDKFWLILFALCWIVLTVAGIWSFCEGNPNRLVQGYDSFGNICGQKNKNITGVSWSGIDMSGKPYVFHLNPLDTSKTLKVCVKKCAEKKFLSEDDIDNFDTTDGSKLMRYDFDPKLKDESYPRYASQTNERKRDQDLGFGPYPKLPVYNQRPVLNRCVSLERIKIENSVINYVYKYFKDLDFTRKFVSDIYESRDNIAYTILFGICVSLVVTFSIHFVATLVSAAIMVVSSVALISFSGFLWYVYIDLKYKLNQIPSMNQLDDQIVNEKTFLILAIAVTVFTLIILTIIFIMRSRVALMVALFHETGACLRSMPALIFQPIWTCAILLIFLMLWTTVFLAVSSAEKEIIYNSTTTRFKLDFAARRIESRIDGRAIFKRGVADLYRIESVKHEQSEFVRCLWWFVVVMLFWSVEFILGCQQMTVASSVASWYFSRDRRSLVCPIGNSIRRIARYHMGSIALGSFLIVLFKIPRLILTYMEYYLKKFQNNSCIRCILKGCQCFFYCLENFISYINHNAYTVIAIEGTGYCFSAKVAFKALATNTLRVVAINTMGDFIIFLGKCIVTASAATFGVYLMRDDTNIYYLAVPVIFATICVYLIAHSMLCVYEMVIDTMFLCFVEDVNKNANSPEGFFAPDGLLKFAEEDGRELRPEALRIANEVNTPRSKRHEVVRTKQPTVGFRLPR